MPTTMPGNRPATKLLPEKSSGDSVAASWIATSSSALEELEVVAAGKVLEVESAVLAALVEVGSNDDVAIELVDVGVVDEEAAVVV